MTGHNDRCTSYPGRRGFTLIEVMVTLIVLAILTTIGFPAYRSFIAGQRIKTASFDVTAALMLARSEAIKRNSNVSITPAGGNWQNGWTVTAGTTTVSRQSNLGGDVNVTCYTGMTMTTPCPTLTYNYGGRLVGVNAATSILLSSTSRTSVATRCITIDPGGRPYAKSPGSPCP